MRLCAKSFLTLAALLFSMSLRAQSDERKPNEEDNGAALLMRLGYSSPWMDGEGFRQICVAVSRDGSYGLLRLEKEQETVSYGKIPTEQFQQLKKLLEDSDLRVISGSHGGRGSILQQSESLGVEIYREGRTQRFEWLNQDENPFPHSVSEVVKWLEDFEPKNRKPLTYPEGSPVCPTVKSLSYQPVNY
jgi:hypothetical protein